MQTCKRCIYNSSIPKITFNTAGICNYCDQYDSMNLQYPIDDRGKKIINDYVEQIKKDGKGKPYDVVIGVSGGCDSSYMLHLAKNVYGLRVLAAHFDNTYNSKIAVENIKVVLDKLNIDLFTYVVDNKEFEKIQKSLLLASVPEFEAATDLALATTHYMACEKYGVKHIWEGHSFRTEGVSPPGWFYMDAKYIKSIHKKFGDGVIKSTPLLWLGKWIKWMVVNKIKKFRPLYYLDYNKEDVKKFLVSEYGWQWYGGHHMENRTAYFINNYYLPVKFGIDLRWCEYSALVRSGRLSREEALGKIKEPKPYEPDLLVEIKSRLKLSDTDWDNIMKEPNKHYTDYPTYKKTFERLRPFFFILLKSGYVTRSFYEKFCVLREKRA
ncbi:MAG: N-acetyl sugar amidotransferase [Bacteroidetes bacterium]|nr:N-acetyl sugar amidotransferase [Bacteroidota bacterium]